MKQYVCLSAEKINAEINEIVILKSKIMKSKMIKVTMLALLVSGSVQKSLHWDLMNFLVWLMNM